MHKNETTTTDCADLPKFDTSDNRKQSSFEEFKSTCCEPNFNQRQFEFTGQVPGTKLKLRVIAKYRNDSI